MDIFTEEKEMKQFKIASPYQPTGDQPEAIEHLVRGVNSNKREQILLGATGTGKTFTMANVIERVQKPTLIMAHNKTLAAQLYEEMKELFPENAVEYFVSYYDYYQPESYVPTTDTYIEKTSTLNDEIDKLRHSATSSLLDRRDVIVVASVSCIYGLGNIDDYRDLMLNIREGQEVDRDEVMRKLIDIQYVRNDIDFHRGTFRVRGDVLEIIPTTNAEVAIRVEFFGDEIERIREVNALTGEVLRSLKHAYVYPASHFVSSEANLSRAMKDIRDELQERLIELKTQNKLLEFQRLEQRTNYDLEMMQEMGFCSGIENYSMHLDGRSVGEPPNTLIDFFGDDFLMIVDESHITIPQIRAMYKGDRSRKQNLVDFGFRLPSALDNRPLMFDEYYRKINQIVYVSATPGDFELEHVQSEDIAQQIIRPTGLLDPTIEIRKTEGQIDDILHELHIRKLKNERVLITTLTKRMSEDLTAYLKDQGVLVTYLHADIDTLERSEIIRSLRLGEIDVVVGINLLREGIDIPEVSLVIILDADKQGFLRNTRSLIQTIGRAARNSEGKVIMYADEYSKAMEEAVAETTRRREIQHAYNLEHGITPQTIRKEVRERISISYEGDTKGTTKQKRNKKQLLELIQKVEIEMKEAAKQLDFESAAELRDVLMELKNDVKNKSN